VETSLDLSNRLAYALTPCPSPKGRVDEFADWIVFRPLCPRSPTDGPITPRGSPRLPPSSRSLPSTTATGPELGRSLSGVGSARVPSNSIPGLRFAIGCSGCQSSHFSVIDQASVLAELASA